MADRFLGSDRGLETWTVATFDVVTVGLVGVLAGHTSGVLGDALADVGTVAGVLAFGYLWALVGFVFGFLDVGLARATDAVVERSLD